MMVPKQNNPPISAQMTKAFWQLAVIVLFSTAIGIGLNSVRYEPLALVGDWSDQDRLLDKNGKDISITLNETRRHFEKKTALFFDARDMKSFDMGHIKGARSVPIQDIDNYLKDLVENVAHETFIITYCDGETCNLSHELALFLSNMGFPNVKVLVNGWAVWQESNLPIETSD